MSLAGGGRRLRHSFYDHVTQRAQKMDLCHIINGDRPSQASEDAGVHCLGQYTAAPSLGHGGGPATPGPHDSSHTLLLAMVFAEFLCVAPAPTEFEM